MTPGVHQFEDKLLDFAYGELQPHEAEAVDAHVRGCTKCSASLAQITTVRRQMQTLAQEPAPEAGLDSLLAFASQHAAQAKASKRPARWWQRLLVPMSSVMALLVVGVVAWRAQYVPDAASVAFQQKNSVVPVVAKVARAQEAARADLDAPREQPEQKSEVEAALKVAKAGQAAKDSDSFDQNFGSGSDALREKREVSKANGAAKPAAVAAAEYKNGAGAYGLSPGSGSAGPAGSVSLGYGPSDDRAADKKRDLEAPKVAYAGAAERKPAAPPASAPVATSAPEPMANSRDEAPAPSKKSMPLGAASGAQKGAQVAQDEAAAAINDGVAQATSAQAPQAQAVRSRVSTVFEGQLSSARAANAIGDRQTEIKESLGVINGGAEREVRAEALKRLCDAYDSLGEADSAQVFCDLLVREFPQSAAARQIALRRSAPGPKTKPTRSKKATAAPVNAR